MLQQLPRHCKRTCPAASTEARLLPYKARYITVWRLLCDWQAANVKKHAQTVPIHCQTQGLI